MWMPSDYYQALLMLIISMICWGSWANALKLMGNVRFELFYWDYIFGTTAMSIVLALTLGSTGSSSESILADLRNSSTESMLFAFAGGVAFNVSNILLTGAIEVAGMAVAFPVGVGLSIIIGVLLSYWITPKNDPIMLFGGVAVLLVAIIVMPAPTGYTGGCRGPRTSAPVSFYALSAASALACSTLSWPRASTRLIPWARMRSASYSCWACSPRSDS